LINIANDGRKLILFCRDENGNQTVEFDNSFYPYYYELSEEGEFTTFDGKRVKRLFVTHPKEVKQSRSMDAYEADIIYTSRYLIDRIDKLDKCPIKWTMIDVEMLCPEFPNPQEAKYPISCIALYNSFTDKIESWYLGDYKTEWEMIDAFIGYMKVQCFDLVLIWNGDGFDMPYLINRNVDFSKKISPIEKVRYGTNGMLYPVGTSIIDYMLVDKKMTLNRKREYSVEARSIEVLGKSQKLKEINFGELSVEHRTRCIADVKDMVEMEKKLQYIPLLDGLRRLSKTKWEDYTYVSRYIDQLLLTEARNKKIILPMKPTKEDGGKDFEGAFREAFHRGRHFNVGCYDLAGAYLNAIIELCLDPANVYEEEVENSIPIEVTDRVSNKVIATYYVKQNPEAILPLVAKKLLFEKNKFKKLKNETDPNSSDYKIIEENYKLWKSISLSAWGVIGNKYFRYYDYRTTSLITSVIRGLLHFIEGELLKKGYTLEYLDTDGAIIDDKGKDISDWLNTLIQEWFQKKFGKSTKILFDYEGNYEKLFIVALTRYRGWLRRPDGTLEEKNVGLEIKRKDSTEFMKQSQKELLELILNKCSKEEAIELIKIKLEEIKNQPLKAISFSCKLSKKPEDYATEIKRGNKTFKKKPYIIVSALKNANLTKKVGELFWWVYCDERIPMAFDDETTIKNVDWAKMKERNIYNKVRVIFEAMEWWKKERGKKFLELFGEFIEKKPRKVKSKKPPKETPKKATEEKTIVCDFEQCMKNLKGICIATEVWNCPKNNESSVYEEPELLKKDNEKPIESYYEE